MKAKLASGIILAACAASAAVVTYDSATTDTISGGTPAGAVVDKTGAGKITADAVLRGSVFVKEGTLAVSPKRHAFSYYRFKIDQLYGGTSDCAEIGEFKFICDGVDVTRNNLASLSNAPDGGGSPSAEGPANAVDGTASDPIGKKFLDKSFGSAETRDKCYLQLTYSQPLEVTGYNWATHDWTYKVANSRTPIAWRVQGSNDGVTWIDLDVQTSFSPKFSNKAWQSDTGFAIAGCDAEGQVVSVSKDAELDVSGAYRVGAIANKGTVALDAESALTFDVPEGGATAVVGGGITGAGGLAKEGNGDLNLIGANGYGGPTTVRDGRLILGRNGATAAKWFRLTVKKNYSSSPTLIDLSEWSFFDPNGNRVGTGLVKAADGTAPRELLPGSCCMAAAYPTGNNETVEKLFDNNPATKICLTGVSPSLTDESTWRTLVVRLPDAAAPVASYNLTVAGDNSGGTGRSPSVWLLEASFDGNSWFDVDEMTSPVMPTAPKTAYNGGNPMPFTQNVNNNEYAAKWLRVTFKSTYSYGTTYLIGLSEWYLYDAAGNRLGKNLTKLDAGTAPKDMTPGSCCLADASYSIGSVNEGPDKMFDDNQNTKLCLTDLHMGSEPSTWRTVVVRLRDSDPAVVRHLFRVCDNTSGKDRSPNKWVVEASYDGENWTPVETRDSVVFPTATYGLYNDGVPWEFAADSTGPANMPAALPAASALEVLSDATVTVCDGSKVGALRVDMDDAGTIDGFCPAANGTLYLDNLVEGDELVIALPIVFANAKDLANLASWSVVVNGKPRARTRFFVKDGVPTVKLPTGLCLIFR